VTLRKPQIEIVMFAVKHVTTIACSWEIEFQSQVY